MRFTQYVSRMRRCAMTVVLDEPGDRLLRMRRHRFIVYRWVWELPGGYVDDGEESLAAAARGVEEDLLIARDPTLAGVRVLILTTFGLDEYIFDALRAGAAGFLVKDTDAAELIRAVRVIAAGEGLLSPGVTRRLIAEFAPRARSPQPARLLDELTAREREVVGLVAAGLSNDDIARRLYVSQSTVKTHVARAMIKLAARDRAQLVVAAYESGLARPGWSGAP